MERALAIVGVLAFLITLWLWVGVEEANSKDWDINPKDFIRSAK